METTNPASNGQTRLQQRLIQIQEREDLKDAEMAALLGIDRTSWVHIKQGDRKPTLSIISRAIDKWWELLAAHMADMNPAFKARDH